MTYTIDNATYNKAVSYPVGHGYDLRSVLPSSVVVHSTEGAVGQTLTSAANYIYKSAAISAHYLIGKQGEIIEFLDPIPYAAWHAGEAQSAYINNKSIGIECLHAQGESWPTVQKDALAWLLLKLSAECSIGPALIDTHGQIALPGPYVRKIDPTNWPHAEFIQWRDSLYAPTTKRYRAKHIYISQRQEGGEPYAGELYPGEEVVADKWYTNGKIHLQDGRGFVDLIDLEPV